MLVTTTAPAMRAMCADDHSDAFPMRGDAVDRVLATK